MQLSVESWPIKERVEWSLEADLKIAISVFAIIDVVRKVFLTRTIRNLCESVSDLPNVADSKESKTWLILDHKLDSVQTLDCGQTAVKYFKKWKSDKKSL